MREIDVKNAIIFCNRKKDVGIVHRSLLRHGFSVGALHGDLDQHQRTATLDAFRNGTIAFLAASDVAARGLDIPEVSHIFNYDVPIHPEDYIHRIGRTGRAGREGFAAMLVTPKDIKALKAIEKMLKPRDPVDRRRAQRSGAERSLRVPAERNGNGRHRRGGRSRRNKRPQGSGAQQQAPNAQRSAPHSGNQDNKRDERRPEQFKHQHHGERKHHQAPPAERPQPKAPHSSRRGPSSRAWAITSPPS